MGRLTKRNANGTPALAGMLDADKMAESMSNGARVAFLDLIKRLAEYEDAEEQGQLARLPLKLGQKVYEIGITWDIVEYEVCGYTIIPPYVYVKYTSDKLRKAFGEDEALTCLLENVGRILFLTYAEAEEACARRKKEYEL